MRKTAVTLTCTVALLACAPLAQAASSPDPHHWPKKTVNVKANPHHWIRHAT